MPVTLTGVCERVDRITINRIQDARIRRLPFQQKIGSGLTREQFAERVQQRTVRHVGLTESIAMIAAAMGWKLDRVTDEIQPKIAETRVSSEFLTVEAGLVCGIIQDGVGYVGGEPLIRLHMEAYLGAPESYDSTEIEGVPNLYDEDRRRRARRHRDNVDRGELDSEGARRASGAAHHAEPAHPLVVQPFNRQHSVAQRTLRHEEHKKTKNSALPLPRNGRLQRSVASVPLDSLLLPLENPDHRAYYPLP